MNNSKFILLFLGISTLSNAQIGVNTADPHPSAILHLESSDKGFLPPRLTEANMNAIDVPGMIVYCTDCDPQCIYVSDGTTFNSLCGSPSPLSMDTTGTNISGLYIDGNAFNADNTITYTIMNSGSSAESLSLQSSDLTLSGGAASGLSVSGVTPSTLNIPPNSSATVMFTLSGTPSSLGVINADFTNGDLTISNAINITDGDANIGDVDVVTVSIYDVGPPIVDDPGTIDNGANQITFNIPYTDAIGTYDAYTSSYVAAPATASETGSPNGFRISFNSSTFSNPTGSISATLEVDGDGTFDPKQLPIGDTLEFAQIPIEINGNIKAIVKLVIVTEPKDMLFGSYSTADNGFYNNCSPADGAEYQDPGLRMVLTDGDLTNSGYGSQADSSSNFLEIDLGTTYTLTGVKVAGGTLSCWGTLGSYHANNLVQAYNTSTSSWDQVIPVSGTNNTSVTELTFPAPIQAQRIRIIRISGSGRWLSYGEFYPVGYF